MTQSYNGSDTPYITSDFPHINSVYYDTHQLCLLWMHINSVYYELRISARYSGVLYHKNRSFFPSSVANIQMYIYVYVKSIEAYILIRALEVLTASCY